MATRLSLAEIRQQLNKAIAKCDRTIEACTGSDHPQIIALLNKTKGERNAFDAVLRALEGDRITLKLFTQEIAHE